ncbi:MAG: heat-inducible transcription repressor HrcA [Gammaproteobacteria bacterium]|nr:heat-inducible transcription repressor HrcA [Gammaproteobacteria bacterium]
MKEAEKKINERALRLLKMVVERYISDGQPVGSKTLASSSAISMSSATIRNVLAELEDAGLLRSPHTSSGRIPTLCGYRLFVDSLMTVQPFADIEVASLKERLVQDDDPKTLIASASSLLSGLTQLAGIVTLPRHKRTLLRHIEFLPLTENRILVILVVNNHEVQNRIIYCENSYTKNRLQEVGNYLTAKYAGHDLVAIRASVINSMHADRGDMELITKSVLDIADKAFERDDDYVVAGQTNLLDMVDDAGVEKLRSIFSAFAKKRDILHILDKCLDADGVQIYIGEESGYDAFDECSLVTKPYEVAGQIVGVLGVVGPKRMSYERVVSAVDVTAKLLSAALRVS